MYKRKNNKIIKKAVRIGADWESFLNEHPDIKVVEENGKITNIVFPKGSTNTTLLIFNGKVFCIEYCLKGTLVKYYDSSIPHINYLEE